MAFALIIALIVVALLLLYLSVEQGRTINKYEQELLNRKTTRVKKGKK